MERNLSFIIYDDRFNDYQLKKIQYSFNLI